MVTLFSVDVACVVVVPSMVISGILRVCPWENWVPGTLKRPGGMIPDSPAP